MSRVPNMCLYIQKSLLGLGLRVQYGIIQVTVRINIVSVLQKPTTCSKTNKQKTERLLIL